MKTPRGLPSIAPIKSWLGSLRPNATSLRAPPEVAAKRAAPVPRSGRTSLLIASAVACAAIAGMATRRAMAPHARVKAVQNVVSGRAGLRTTASGADERWSQAAVTVTVDPTLAQATPAARDAIMSAFGAWAGCGASLPQLSFDVTSIPGQAVEDGVNRLLLGPITMAGHEDNLAITISYTDAGTGQILEADTIFNSAYDWTSIDVATAGSQPACGQHYDLQNVATHEAGHFFGLGEDYSNQATTMYVSSELCQTSKRALSLPDVSVVSGLYKGGPGGGAPAAACAVVIPGARGTGRGAFAAFAALAVVGLGMRRRRNRIRLDF